MSYFKKILAKKQIVDHKDYWVLLLAGFLFIILRLPSLVEPSWYGDEGIYQVIGHAINKGALLYRDIWDNKPPLLYLLYAIFNSNLFYLKLLSLLAGLLSIFPFFLVAKKLLQRRKIIYFVTILFVILFGSPLLEGNIANAENFMLLPILIAVYLVLSYTETNKKAQLYIGGVLLSVALVTKIVAIFDVVSLAIFLIVIKYDQLKIASKKINLKSISSFTTEIKFFIFSFSLLILFGIYFLAQGAFLDFIHAVFIQNINYIEDQNQFTFPIVILGIKVALLIISLLFVLSRRARMSRYSLFLYIWTLFGIFSAFFSQRPYTHYVLVILPAFCYLVGSTFLHKNKARGTSFLAIVIALVTFFYFKTYQKPLEYYGNYLSFVFGNKKVEDYQLFFDPYTPRDYEVAHFINLNTKESESVLIWSDNAQIYALSHKLPPGKYVVAYHVTFYKDALADTLYNIEKKNPRYIIQTKESPELKILLNSFVLKYKMDGVYIYERQI